jgi:hypothetical protein
MLLLFGTRRLFVESKDGGEQENIRVIWVLRPVKFDRLNTKSSGD